jgi:AcrR family transcriptional regulator
MDAVATDGLREAKKRRTRATIASVAMELFTARGFDEVTVAEIARAAGVSEKTVFNYFPAKEDLVLERGQERRLALLEAVRDRPAGASLVEPFREQTLALLDHVEHDAPESILAVPRLVMGSRALRDRLFFGWEREADELVPAVARHAGVADDDLVAQVVARTLTSTQRLVFRAAFTRLMAGDDPRTVATDLRKQAAKAYDQLEAGLAGYAP